MFFGELLTHSRHMSNMQKGFKHTCVQDRIPWESLLVWAIIEEQVHCWVRVITRPRLQNVKTLDGCYLPLQERVETPRPGFKQTLASPIGSCLHARTPPTGRVAPHTIQITDLGLMRSLLTKVLFWGSGQTLGTRSGWSLQRQECHY